MLLAGAAPVDAVRLQLVLLYVLLGGVALAACSRSRSLNEHSSHPP
jgi:ABC-type iron transport system FetAB permease component